MEYLKFAFILSLTQLFYEKEERTNLNSTCCKTNGNLVFEFQGMASRSLQIQIEELMKMRCDLERVSDLRK